MGRPRAPPPRAGHDAVRLPLCTPLARNVALQPAIYRSRASRHSENRRMGFKRSEVQILSPRLHGNHAERSPRLGTSRRLAFRPPRLSGRQRLEGIARSLPSRGPRVAGPRRAPGPDTSPRRRGEGGRTRRRVLDARRDALPQAGTGRPRANSPATASPCARWWSSTARRPRATSDSREAVVPHAAIPRMRARIRMAPWGAKSGPLGTAINT